MFLRRKKEPRPIEYDRESEEPVLRCSICTGEKTAGFRNLKTGKLREYGLIRTEQELEEFKKACGTEEIKKIY